MPRIRQFFVGRRAEDGEAFERKLYVIRRRLHKETENSQGCYVVSLANVVRWLGQQADVAGFRTVSDGVVLRLRDELWLRRWHGNGATEWHEVLPELLEIPSIARINIQLQRFGAWLGLTHQDRPWRLSTHQGRKTFARFAALRDRTCLFALAQQLGHRERAETDHGYAGSDYRLAQEIDAEEVADVNNQLVASVGTSARVGCSQVEPLSLASRLRKRAFDLAVTIPLLMFLTPLMLFVAVAIRIVAAQSARRATRSSRPAAAISPGCPRCCPSWARSAMRWWTAPNGWT